MKRKLPRCVKITLNLLLVLVVSFLFWAELGYPRFSYAQRNRQLERDALVGPGTIIDVLDHSEYNEFSKLHVGITDEGFLFYADSKTSSKFTYVRRTGKITVAPAPVYWENWDTKTSDEHLPIYVFDEYRNAVRAELEIHIASNPENEYYRGEPFSRHYSLCASRETAGFFLFHLYVPSGGKELGIEGYAPQSFSALVHDPEWDNAKESVDVVVRLYDKNGNLITEQKQTIRNIIGTVHTP
jgi:hypothetical protein